ncbi:hypothetical protein [Williamsia sp. CHRR-6]|uniref:hypothetical protein n=1 Tax=Williamsia sp. CHRR-6 TaxID=2835871 RepID=UPI001BD993EF|nr:hypothetical protein [Williamsia sp. CHRR-6]MBT0567512.1 hypothetical protein [Williamsia sp. CHRR-6]
MRSRSFAVAVFVCAGIALTSSGCSDSGDSGASASSSVAPATETTSAATAQAPAATATQVLPPPSAQNVAAFVTAFKAQFPDLVGGRSDAAIATVFDQSCLDVRSGKDALTVSNALGDRVKVGSQQAEAVYGLLIQYCR